MKYTREREVKVNQQKMTEMYIQHPDYLVDSLWGTPTAFRS